MPLDNAMKISAQHCSVILVWYKIKKEMIFSELKTLELWILRSLLNFLFSHWTKVNLNSNWTDPCAGLFHVRQEPARPDPMQVWFQLWWRGRTYYSTRPIIGLFYPTSLVQCVFINLMINFFIFSLYLEKCIQLSQSEWRIQNPEQPIRSREIWNYARHLMRELNGRNVWISKLREKSRLSKSQKCPTWILR